MSLTYLNLKAVEFLDFYTLTLFHFVITTLKAFGGDILILAVALPIDKKTSLVLDWRRDLTLTAIPVPFFMADPPYNLRQWVASENVSALWLISVLPASSRYRCQMFFCMWCLGSNQTSQSVMGGYEWLPCNFRCLRHFCLFLLKIAWLD